MKGRLVCLIRARGRCVRVGKLSEGDGTKKRGGKQRFKKGDQAGSRGGCLKNRGSWNPLLNYGNILTFGSV